MKLKKKYLPIVATTILTVSSWTFIGSEINQAMEDQGEPKKYQIEELQWIADHHGYDHHGSGDGENYSFTIKPSEDKAIIASYQNGYSLNVVNIGGTEELMTFDKYSDMFTELSNQLN